jgi:hypothetical protein
MKTLKPFPYVGSDVDVLIKSPDHFSKAIKALIQNNFQMMGHDLFSATLLKADFDVYVDLQLELSVSGLPYLPKNLIIQNTKTVNVNGTSVTTLADFAEATVTACHCYYKEHMYTLADFYTTTFYVNDQTWEKFCELATTTNNIVAITALLLWTRRVAYEAFGIRLKGVEKALKKLHPSVESNLVANSNLSFPQIFPKSLVVLGVAGKVVQDHYTRSSLPRALQTSASRRQFRILVEHFKRESY